jgi:hypothetical protein
MHRLLAAMKNSRERDCKGDLDVLAAWRRSAAPEHALERARRPEIKAESAENVGEVDAAEQVFGREARDAHMAARIIFDPFLRIAQNRVGLGDFPEAVGRVGRLVAVGMILKGELAKGVLDRFLVGVPRHAQRFIIVARIGHGSPSLSPFVSALAFRRMASRGGDARSRGSSSGLRLPRVTL